MNVKSPPNVCLEPGKDLIPGGLQNIYTSPGISGILPGTVDGAIPGTSGTPRANPGTSVTLPGPSGSGTSGAIPGPSGISVAVPGSSGIVGSPTPTAVPIIDNIIQARRRLGNFFP